MTIRKLHNIIYFNVYQFYCFCFFWLGKPRYSFLKLNGLDGAKDKPQQDDDDDSVNSVRGRLAISLTDRFMGALYFCIVLIPWNLVTSLLQLEPQTWKYGLYFLIAVGVVAIFAFNHEYKSDFKKFRSWSKNERRKYAVITLLIISGIFTALIGSFVLHLSLLTN